MKEEVKEAKRYLLNAKEILRDKAGKKDRFYADKKYVRMAGNTAYNGVLEALDAIVPAPQKGKRKSMGHYKDYLAKKDKKILSLELKRNPDIIAEIGKNKSNRILVGFAMETQNLLANAREKLKKKNMDLIVANNLQEEGAGFRTDTNIITIIDSTGKAESFEKMTKIEAAEEILNHVQKIIKKKGNSKK